MTPKERAAILKSLKELSSTVKRVTGWTEEELQALTKIVEDHEFNLNYCGIKSLQEEDEALTADFLAHLGENVHPANWKILKEQVQPVVKPILFVTGYYEDVSKAREKIIKHTDNQYHLILVSNKGLNPTAKVL